MILLVAAAMIVTGHVSRNPHQHMIEGERAKQAHYFDTEDGGQLVVYSKEKLPEDVRLRLTGSEHVIEGQSKRPGSKKRVTEKQMIVEKHETLPSFEELIAKLPDDKPAYAALVEAKLAAVPALIACLDDSARGKRCEYALHDIVEPPFSRQQIAAMAPKSDQKIAVDWKPWWEKRRHKSLREIHDELLPYVNRYWRSGGETQKVPVEP